MVTLRYNNQLDSRVSVLPEPWLLPYEKKYGGCRTWVDLPSRQGRGETGATPVIENEEFVNLQREVEELVGP